MNSPVNLQNPPVMPRRRDHVRDVMYPDLQDLFSSERHPFNTHPHPSIRHTPSKVVNELGQDGFPLCELTP